MNITETTKATYINAINKASLGYVTNTYTRDEALKQSITQMKHLEVYLDTAGRRWTPEGYVSMVLKSNKRQVVTDLQFGAAQEIGTDIIEVSEHAGARPGCAPFQGRFFSLSNQSGTATDGAGNVFTMSLYPQQLTDSQQDYKLWAGSKPFARDTIKALWDDSCLVKRNIRTSRN